MNSEIKDIMNNLNIWEKINYNKVILNLFDDYSDEKFINYFKKIDYYLFNSYETPLLLTFNNKINSGLFFSKWNNYNKDKNNIIIPVFGTFNDKNRNLYEILYLILIELREHFNISQKVNFVGKKIRKDFDYWMEIVNKKMNKNPSNKGKVILLFESVDLYSENEINMKEFLIKYWISKKILDRFRIIITCSKSSMNYKYCKEINIKEINIYVDKVLENKIQNQIKNSLYNLYKMQQKINYLNNLYYYLTNENIKFENQREGEKQIEIVLLEKYDFYFIIAFLDFIFPLKGDYCSNVMHYFQNFLYSKIIDKYSIYYEIINFFSLTLTNDNNIKLLEKSYKNQLIDCLKNYIIITSLTSKGLSLEEILNFLSIKEKFIYNIKYLFYNSIKEHNGYYKNINIDLIDFTNNLIKDNKEKMVFHSKLAISIDMINNSIRKIEEQTYHYLVSKEYFILKQTICNIENFMLLYNSKSKFKLFKYWKFWINQNYDPVIEYDKSIELYEMHFQPDENSLFKIIIQISRFFKEFSEFELFDIPEFKHPLIKNKILSLYKNNIKIKTNSIDSDESSNDIPKIINKKKKNIEWDSDNSIEINKKLENDDSEIIQHREGLKKNYLYSIGVLKEFKKFNLYDKNDNSDILKDIEKYNFFKNNNNDTEKIKENIKEKNEIEKLELDENILNTEFDFEVNEIEDNFHENMNFNKEQKKIKNKFEIINKEKMMDQNFYYYKRWLWLIFPWVSLSIDNNCNFSIVMSKTSHNDIYYMSVEEEKHLTQQVQKIVIESKIKKQLLLKSNNSNLVGIKLIKEHKPKIENNVTYMNNLNKKKLFNNFKNKIKNEFLIWKKQKIDNDQNQEVIIKNKSIISKKSIMRNNKNQNGNNFFITSINDDNFIKNNKNKNEAIKVINNKDSIKVLNETSNKL